MVVLALEMKAIIYVSGLILKNDIFMSIVMRVITHNVVIMNMNVDLKEKHFGVNDS